MKLNQLSIFGFASALLLSVASCSSDDIINDQPEVLDADQYFYMNISVNGESTRTRALHDDGDFDYNDNADYDPSKDPDFNKGTQQENEVKTIYLLFYDAAGNKLKNFSTALNKNDNYPLTDNENSLYQGTVQVAVNKGEKIPSYVLAFVNPVNTTFPDNEFGTLNLTEQTLRDDLINGNGDFSMSNSVYYGYDPVSGQANTRIMATPIQADQIFNSQDEAEKALGDYTQDPAVAAHNTVDIYVERYAAKVNFSIAEGQIIKGINVKDALTDETLTLTFNPEYWTVNADEKKSFVTKTYFDANVDGTINFDQPLPYDAVNAALGNNGWMWNSPLLHRSYWAQSPGYYTAKYPRTADELTAAPNGTYSLNYYTYNEIKNNAEAGAGDKALASAVAAQGQISKLYTRENTVQGAALRKADTDQAGPRAAIASVVMVGAYNVAKSDGTAVNDPIFYITGSEDSYFYFNADNMKKFFLDNGINFYKKDVATDTYVPVFAYNKQNQTWKDGVIDADYAGMFDLAHPTAGVLGDNMTLDSRYVALQVKADQVDSHDLYAEINGVKVLVTEDNLDEVNRQLLSSAGTARGFNGGKAFFNIPIQHLGFQRANNTQKAVSPNSQEFKWQQVHSGDFGVVRNHIYTINVNKIEKLGNAIPDPDVPIVPPNDEEYYISARIFVLNWALVPQQNVDL